MLANVDSASKDVTTQRKSSFNYITPPPPVLSLRSIPSKTNEGIVSYNLLLSSTSDTSNYPVSVTTTLSYGTVENIVEIEGFEEL